MGFGQVWCQYNLVVTITFAYEYINAIYQKEPSSSPG